MASVYALVLAAGEGTRFGGSVPKQYLPLCGESLLSRAVGVFLRHERVGGVLVAIRPQDRALYERATAGLPLLPPVEGGATRQESAHKGLEALAPLGPDRVLIHDAARPFPSALLIDRVIDALDECEAAIPLLPLRDTIKEVEEGAIRGTIDRSHLWRAQTPQGFHFNAILAAHRLVRGRALTDDSAVAEAAGLVPVVVEGSENNIKVTSDEDLKAAERRLAAREDDFRVGQGFDVHPFCPGNRLFLCGVEIPFERGLEGHSDADVGLHALSDALLGAIGAGDISMHFPSGDARWKGASSEEFVRHAARLVRERGGSVAAVDLTLVCEKPRVGPYREAMIARIAAILGIAPGRVGVKATTTDGLGFTGRGEGIAALAIATVRLPL